MVGQRLSKRLAGVKPDGPHEGMPKHVLAGVIHWFEGVAGYRGAGGMHASRLHQLAAHMEYEVYPGMRPQIIMSALSSAAEEDETFAVDMVDGILDIWPKDGGGANRWAEVNGLLTAGASVWRVNAERDGLIRVVSDEVRATFASATSAADEATRELREAWTNAFGRNGDPSDAWDHAIKAIETVLTNIVVPNQNNATLGHVLGQLRNQGNLWEMALPGPNLDGTVAPLVAMLELIWPNPDRHGGGTPRQPTQEEARAVVTLAATIVQWHRDGWIVRRR